MQGRRSRVPTAYTGRPPAVSPAAARLSRFPAAGESRGESSAGERATIPLSVVSNSLLMREGLMSLLSAHAPVRLIGAYAGESAADGPPPNPPDHVVLLDGGIGTESALAWTGVWTRLTPPASVIVVELLDDADLILACIEAGACGYTLRGASVGEVADVIVQARRGVAHCSPEITARLFARVAMLSAARARTAADSAPLTARELDVLRCIAADCSNQEIAERLVLQLATVKHHVHNILDKLNLRHRWDAARLAVESGWLDEGAGHSRTSKSA